MFYQRMPLYLMLTELLKSEYRLVSNFSKEYKYSLGQDIVAITQDLVDLFIDAHTSSSSAKQRKIEIIDAMNHKHESLKLRIRFCGELKLISARQQALLNQLTTETGNMIGSWIKNV